MSILLTALRNGQVGGTEPAEPKEADIVSAFGTIGYYHDPAGRPVPEWREHLKDELLPFVYLTGNGADLAGIGVWQLDYEHFDASGAWVALHVWSVVDHRQGPFPNASVDDKLGWVDFNQGLKDGRIRRHITKTKAVAEAKSVAAEYTKHAATPRYRRGMGIKKGEASPVVEFLGEIELYDDGRPLGEPRDRWDHLGDTK